MAVGAGEPVIHSKNLLLSDDSIYNSDRTNQAYLEECSMWMGVFAFVAVIVICVAAVFIASYAIPDDPPEVRDVKLKALKHLI